MRRFLADGLPSQDERVTLSSEQSHHLLRVVGIGPDEVVILLDGKGGSCQAKIAHIEGGLATLQFVAAQPPQEQGPELWMCLALTKPPAFSLALRMLTEIGVAHIVPVITERSQRRGEKEDRWKRILLSALQQSGRSHMPTLYPLQPLEAAIRLCEPLVHRYFLHPHTLPLSGQCVSCAAFIGPEGGFSTREIGVLEHAGWHGRSLGFSVLRADTAAAVSAGILAQPTS